MASQGIKKEGNLEKKSRYLGVWRKRWTVLTPKSNTVSAVSTYKKEKQYKSPTECIRIDTETDIVAYPASEDKGDLLFYIQNIRDKERFLFKAESKHDRDEWIKCITNANKKEDKKDLRDIINGEQNENNINDNDIKQEEESKPIDYNEINDNNETENDNKQIDNHAQKIPSKSMEKDEKQPESEAVKDDDQKDKQPEPEKEEVVTEEVNNDKQDEKEIDKIISQEVDNIIKQEVNNDNKVESETNDHNNNPIEQQKQIQNDSDVNEQPKKVENDEQKQEDKPKVETEPIKDEQQKQEEPPKEEAPKIEPKPEVEESEQQPSKVEPQPEPEPEPEVEEVPIENDNPPQVVQDEQPKEDEQKQVQQEPEPEPVPEPVKEEVKNEEQKQPEPEPESQPPKEEEPPKEEPPKEQPKQEEPPEEEPKAEEEPKEEVPIEDEQPDEITNEQESKTENQKQNNNNNNEAAPSGLSTAIANAKENNNDNNNNNLPEEEEAPIENTNDKFPVSDIIKSTSLSTNKDLQSKGSEDEIESSYRSDDGNVVFGDRWGFDGINSTMEDDENEKKNRNSIDKIDIDTQNMEYSTICMIGNKKSGKTILMNKLLGNKDDEKYQTTNENVIKNKVFMGSEDEKENGSMLCTFIDTSGDINNIQQTINGISLSDIAIITISLLEEIDIIREYIRILNTYGIDKYICCLTYIDHIQYNQSKYNDIQSKVEKIFKKIGIKAKKIAFIPVNTIDGDNIVENNNDKLEWYKGWTLKKKTGMTVLDAIQTITRDSKKKTDIPFIMVVNNTSDDIAYGKIEQGQINKGDKVRLSSNNETVTIMDIKRCGQSMDTCKHGDYISIKLDNTINSNDVLYMDNENKLNIKSCKTITALVVVSGIEKMEIGFKGIICIKSNVCNCEISGINWKGDKKNTDVEYLGDKEQGQVVLKMDDGIIGTTDEECVSLGRFVVLSENKVVLVGKIESVSY